MSKRGDNGRLDVGLDINYARKKRRQKLFKKWFRVVVFVFVVLSAMFYLWNFVVKPKIVETNLANFPVSVGSENVVSFEKLSSGFCLLTRRNLNFYEKDGTKSKSVECKFENPRICCNKNLALVYDQGGKICEVHSFESSNLNRVVLNENILFAKVAENETFAVVTESDSFFCVLNVFDKTGQLVFRWNSAGGLIVDFEFLSGAKGCVVCTMGVGENGFEKAEIYGLNFDRNKENFRKVLTETVPFKVKRVGLGFGLVCSNRLCFFDLNGGLVKSLPFFEDFSSFDLTDRGFFAFSFANRLIVYDKFLNVLGRMELNENIKRVKFFGKRVFVLVDNRLYVCNLGLKILKTVEINKLANDFYCDESCGYFLFGSRVEKFKIF